LEPELDTSSHFLYRRDLFHEDDRVNDHSVAYDVECILSEDAGGNRVENKFRVPELQGVSCIGSPLETGYDFIFGREYIHDLTFPLVAPLEPEYNICLFHDEK